MDRSEKCPVITLHKRCSGCLKRTKCGGGSWCKIENAEGIYEYVINIKEDFLKKITRISL
jgi:hypothetical protein